MIKYAEDFIKNKPDNVHVVSLKNRDIMTERELIKACEQNACGHYGKNWMCPPHVGQIDELIAKIRSCGDGVLIQSVHKIEDPFDYEGMMAGADLHTKSFRALFETVKENSGLSLLPLNAGSCTFCAECACRKGEPCRFPDKALASVESHGVDVNGTLGNVELKYNNGPNTVSYVGVILERKLPVKVEKY